ncbi:MFS general substrate transporter [Sodiomyces alkalinus F11]|uniref:MFS general substrate transporter n=1 Tax=Sodiomyces alkalinus (strain CBS 110278 / VKM F-3762 / F11) TaxID=1314773 RepID=A0A3N2PT99_SODAK|nr:MFS general substrate transporter [Sodiomyces alkalinus F11]ROT37737.1 MFS general substrate transporter [Sodiomyces alkalinus F11]
MVSPIVLGMYNIGAAVGPLVGGSITDSPVLTWRFIFWLNLPFGAVGLVMVCLALRKPPPAVKGGLPWTQKMRQLDIPGGYSAARCNIVFEPGSAVGSRTVSASCGFMMLVQVAIVLHSYFWPMYFQSVRNTSARDSGIFLLPLIVSNILGTLCGGTFASKSGHYVPLMWIGAPILAVGGGLYQLIHADSPRGEWMGFRILSRFGYGIYIPTGLVTILLFQMLGGALAPSAGQNLFTDGLLRSLNEVGIDAAAVVAAGGRPFRELVPPERMSAVVDAFNSALRNMFWVALAAPALAWIVSWAMEWRGCCPAPRVSLPPTTSRVRLLKLRLRLRLQRSRRILDTKRHNGGGLTNVVGRGQSPLTNSSTK